MQVSWLVAVAFLDHASPTDQIRSELRSVETLAVCSANLGFGPATDSPASRRTLAPGKRKLQYRQPYITVILQPYMSFLKTRAFSVGGFMVAFAVLYFLCLYTAQILDTIGMWIQGFILVAGRFRGPGWTHACVL
jgi:hypothetical protein